MLLVRDKGLAYIQQQQPQQHGFPMPHFQQGNVKRVHGIHYVTGQESQTQCCKYLYQAISLLNLCPIGRQISLSYWTVCKPTFCSGVRRYIFPVSSPYKHPEKTIQIMSVTPVHKTCRKHGRFMEDCFSIVTMWMNLKIKCWVSEVRPKKRYNLYLYICIKLQKKQSNIQKQKVSESLTGMKEGREEF